MAVCDEVEQSKDRIGLIQAGIRCRGDVEAFATGVRATVGQRLQLRTESRRVHVSHRERG